MRPIFSRLLRNSSGYFPFFWDNFILRWMVQESRTGGRFRCVIKNKVLIFEICVLTSFSNTAFYSYSQLTVIFLSDQLTFFECCHWLLWIVVSFRNASTIQVRVLLHNILQDQFCIILQHNKGPPIIIDKLLIRLSAPRISWSNF